MVLGFMSDSTIEPSEASMKTLMDYMNLKKPEKVVYHPHYIYPEHHGLLDAMSNLVTLESLLSETSVHLPVTSALAKVCDTIVVVSQVNPSQKSENGEEWLWLQV